MSTREEVREGLVKLGFEKSGPCTFTIDYPKGGEQGWLTVWLSEVEFSDGYTAEVTTPLEGCDLDFYEWYTTQVTKVARLVGYVVLDPGVTEISLD